jgi:hypothetical protein
MQQKLIERLAREHLGVPQSRINGWRLRGQVPHRHRLKLLELAEREGVRLSADDFENILTKPERVRRQARLAQDAAA